MQIFIVIVLNWTIKLFAAWLMYLLAVWLNVPEWAMIAMVALGAVETKVELSWS